MSSKSSSQLEAAAKKPPTPSGPPTDTGDEPTVVDLMRQLQLKDQEILALKLELERFRKKKRSSTVGELDTRRSQQYQVEDRQSDKCENDTSEKSASYATDDTTLEPSPKANVLFKAGADEDEDDDDDDDDDEQDEDNSNQGQTNTRDEIVESPDEYQCNHDRSSSSKAIDDVIQQVTNVDIDLDMSDVSQHQQQLHDSKELNISSKHQDVDDSDVDEDVMSDHLLTSLTDAAISNLSQLAALQERCESQQQHSHQQHQSHHHHHHHHHHQPQTGSPDRIDPFSSSPISNQEAIAISSASTIIGSAAHQLQPISTSSSMTSDSTSNQSDLISGHSLARVVAAAAAAAAAANDQQEHPHHQCHPHPHPHHQPPMSGQTRLITSVSPLPDFFHNLRNQQSQHAQQMHHQSPIPSGLHFSPSTSVTPSPCSLIGSQSRRSANSNTTTSPALMSPISSPNYLRRQFMPERVSILSLSPTTSGFTTGSSSGASSSLGHILQHGGQRSASALAGGPITSHSSLSTPMSGTGSSAVSPLMSNKNSSQARLNNMQIRHKFGYLGSGRAQFNSPHGFCLGLNQEIVVADTNNHRVCIFDKSGSYITQFGSPGKEEGQLWNPRKVAILHRQCQQTTTTTSNSSSMATSTASHSASIMSPSSQHQQQRHHLQAQSTSSSYSNQVSSNSSVISLANNSNNQIIAATSSSTGEPLYVVCDRGAERSRMQLFTKDGSFIKKIGIHYIDIVAGLAITQNGLIIVVDSVSPTVYIINGETGILNGWFDCSGHMKEPSDIAVKSDLHGNEYFICDFKGHCVVVFSEQGEYLRKIGHDGLTSYPNGIDISDDGDILVGDSHGNRFHVVVFDRNGNFVSQFECPHVKVSRCCGLKITREGYIVTLAKNNHHVLVLDTIHI